MKKTNNKMHALQIMAFKHEGESTRFLYPSSWVKFFCCLIAAISLSISGCKKFKDIEPPPRPELNNSQEFLLKGENATVEELPVILFVPGFTGALGGHTLTKSRYYKHQKEFFIEKGRTVYDMNDRPDFDSDRTAIQCNSDAIVAMIKKIKDVDKKRITIISHSKGGQEVLHALTQADNESSLKYRSGVATPLGKILNRHLWQSIAGWVSLTSNFFESEFKINPTDGCNNIKPDHHGDNLPLKIKCQVADNAASIYKNYEIYFGKFHDFPRKINRQQYMRDHRTAIADLMNCVTTLCAYATYIPSRTANPLTPDNAGLLGRSNQWIRNNSQEKEIKLDGANDGLVPARASRIPGARFEINLKDGDTHYCGVDHLAPAVLPLDVTKWFWTPKYQKTKTNEFVKMVEAASIIPPSANAGPDQIIGCGTEGGSTVKLDGSRSKGSIEKYEWFKNNNQIASGVRPQVMLEVGTHEIFLEVSNSCGSIDKDKVVITINDVYDPGINFDINPAILWPPNGQLHLVAKDILPYGFCNSVPVLTVTVTCNEQTNGNDWQIIQTANGGYDVWVRAKRNGNGNGRIYTITALASDNLGNTVTKTGTVTVPHDQRN